MSLLNKTFQLIIALGLTQLVSAQSFTLEGSSMLAPSGFGGLAGVGKGASIGFQSAVTYNVRLRVNYEIQFFKGNANTITTYGTYYNWPSPDITYPITNSLQKMRYSEFSVGYDYFLFRAHPNMYIGPDIFIGKTTANTRREDTYYGTYDDAQYGFFAGLRIHYGVEKKIKKLTLFGEYGAAFNVHSPYLSFVEPNLLNYGLNHQIGLGFRF